MIDNTVLLDRTARIVNHPALRHPLAGEMLSLQVGGMFGRKVDIQLYAADGPKRGLGSVIVWAYLLHKPTIELIRSGATVHVAVSGELGSDRTRVICVFVGDVAHDLAERIDWDEHDRAPSSIHHLRTVQVRTLTPAVAA